MREAPALMRWITTLVSPPPERVVAAIVRVASAPEFAGQSGRFYHAGKEITADAYARDPKVQSRLWAVSAQLAKVDL
jgi:hypothetical protein